MKPKKKVQMAAPEDDEEEKFENQKGPGDLKERTGTMAGAPLED